MRDPIEYGGIVVAVVGFVVTRLFVAEALRADAALPFLLSGLVPLLVGFAVTIYGVGLLVGSFSRMYIYETTRWCLIGTVGMVLLVATTSLEPAIYEMRMSHVTDAPLLVGNVVLAATGVGLLFGDRVAKNRNERRENRRQANRALLVNRLLRHEVLNAATIVDGHAELLDARSDTSSGSRSVTAIRNAASRIRSTVEEVGTIADTRPTQRVDLEPVLREQAAELTESMPDATVRVAVETSDTTVVADHRIELAVRELLTNAVENGEVPRVEARITADSNAVRLSVADDGPGLPPDQRELLEAGTFPEYDDPSAGFGLQIVHLLVDQFGGEIRIGDGIDGTGTTIAMALPRTTQPDPLAKSISVTFPNLYRAGAAGLVAGLVAGGVMDAFFATLTGLLPVIGALYGVSITVVGWMTHLFHSVVFALPFAVGSTGDRLQSVASKPLYAGGLGVAWGTVLWLVAAGVIMPVWLSLVGINTPLPNLSGLGFVGHALWGFVLGTTFWVLSQFGVGDDV